MAAKKTKRPKTKRRNSKRPKVYAYMVLVTGASDKAVIAEAEKLRSMLTMKRVRFLAAQNSLGMRGPADRLVGAFVTHTRQIAGDNPAVLEFCATLERQFPQ